MKLLRLKLNSEFRSLHAGFEVTFLRDFDSRKVNEFMPYCLAGRNGSGKSNILEALAAIFYHIDCMYLSNKPDGFENVKFDSGATYDGGATYDSDEGVFDSSMSYPDAFELEYLIPVKWSNITKSFSEMGNTKWNELYAHISITKAVGKSPEVFCLNKEKFERDYKEQKLIGTEIKDVLPEYIVGYSSGENEILSLPFFKMRFLNFDEYEDRLRNEYDYPKPEGRLVYIDNQFSQAIFLSNFLMDYQEKNSKGEIEKTPLQIIFDTIGVKRIKQFRIIIQQKVQVQKFVGDIDAPQEETPLSKEQNPTYELTSMIQSTIDKFKSCSSAQFFDRENKVLYLDYLVNEETQKAFRLMFENDALSLFSAFQILLTLNLYSVDRKLKMDLYASSSLYVNETVPVLASDQRIMRFKDLEIDKEFAEDEIYNKSLSDGEHQFLHSLNLCLIFKNTNSLFLLDEPETHFNPDWRAKFITTLRDCFKNDKMREILLTTHSPFIISDSHESNVLKFVKDKETGFVTCERPDFKTFGASVNQITIKMFGKVETIGNYAKEELIKLYKRFEQGENADKLLEEADILLGDSVEKIIFEKHINEKRK